MTAERHDRWAYYRCCRQTYRRDLCAARACNSERAHASLANVCGRLRISPELSESIKDAVDEILEERESTTEGRADAIREERQSLFNTELRLTDGFTAGDVSPLVYKTKIDEIRRRQQVLDQEERRVNSPSQDIKHSVARTLEIATSIWHLYETFDIGQRAQLIQAVFKAIVINHEGIVGVTLNEPFSQLMNPESEWRSNERLAAQRLIETA